MTTKIPSPSTAMPLQIPLLAFLMLALGAAMLLAPRHVPAPADHYAMAVDASAGHATPYGSSAALRNLLF